MSLKNSDVSCKLSHNFLWICEPNRITPSRTPSWWTALDTICFSESARRFSQEDKMMAQRLEGIMGSESVTRQEVFQQLIKAKNKKPSSLEELLEKDLKHATCKIMQSANSGDKKRVAVSSISGLLAQDLLTHTPFNPLKDDVTTDCCSHEDTSSPLSSPGDRILEKLESFRLQNKYLGIVILGIRNSDPTNVQRDLALYFPNNSLLQKVRNSIHISLITIILMPSPLHPSHPSVLSSWISAFLPTSNDDIHFNNNSFLLYCFLRKTNHVLDVRKIDLSVQPTVTHAR